MSAKWRTFQASARLTIQDYLTQPAWPLWLTFTPFIFAVVASFLYRGASEELFALYVILGAGAMGMWTNVLGGTSYSMMAERRWGTIIYNFTTPASQLWIAAGKSLVHTVIGLITVLEILLVTAVFYGLPRITIASPIPFLLGLLLVLLNFAVIGFFLNGFFMLTRSASNWQNSLSRFLFVFCGAMFPVTVLPDWMQTIAYILPPTWGLEAIRLAAVESGALTHPLYLSRVGLSTGLMVLYAVIAARLQTIIEHRLRVTAELERI